MLLVPAAMKGVTPVFRSIVCAIDLSSRSSTMIASLARAASDAGRLAFLYVLRGRRPFRRVVVPASSAKALDASHQLHSLVDAQYSGSDVLVSVSSNSVHEEILRVARERDADLIVLGATRHSGLRRWFLGSTALRVSRRSYCRCWSFPLSTSSGSQHTRGSGPRLGGVDCVQAHRPFPRGSRQFATSPTTCARSTSRWWIRRAAVHRRTIRFV